MATKAQLKEYFKSQKIPTEAQFGTLVDSFINNPSTDITKRPNQNLFLVMVKTILIFKVFVL